MSADVLASRNQRRAAGLRQASRALTPSLRTVVIGCADHRADPAHVLGLEPGEAIVLRNPGGRVTPDVVRSLLVLSTVASVEHVEPGFEILVMHHTDCGLTRLDDPAYAALMAEYAGVPVADVPTLALADPRRAALHDARLLADLVRPSGSTVTAAVYDLETGLVERLGP